MRIVICDDCQQDALHLKSFLAGHEVNIYNGAKQLLNDTVHADLYLLDIYIEEDDAAGGIELAKKIRERDKEAAICFISGSDAYYRDAYDLFAVQYLLKPVQKEDMTELLERISRGILRDREQRVKFDWHKETGSIPYGRILYITSRAHTLSIVCKDGYIQPCRGKLNELQTQISADVFCRCHQSFLVNMYQVDSLCGNELVIGSDRIPISRRFYPDVKKRYQEVLFEEVD